MARPRRATRCIGARAGGQSATEFALIAPILLFLIFGIIQYGVLMFDRSALAFAAKEGARIASIHGAEPDANSQVCAAIVHALASSGADPSALGTVSIFRANDGDFTSSQSPTDNPSAHDVGTCTGGSWTYSAPWDNQYSSYRPYQRNIIVPTDRIGVSVSYTFHFILPIFGNTLTWQDSDIVQMEPEYAAGSTGVTAPTPAPTYTVVPWPTATCYPTSTPYPTYTPIDSPTTTATATANLTNTPIATATASPTSTPGGC